MRGKSGLALRWQDTIPAKFCPHGPATSERPSRSNFDHGQNQVYSYGTQPGGDHVRLLSPSSADRFHLTGYRIDDDPTGPVVRNYDHLPCHSTPLGFVDLR